MSHLMDILKLCSDRYYNYSDYYKLSASDCVQIEKEVGEKIFESYPIEVNDSLYDLLCQIGRKLYPDNDYWKLVGSKATGFGKDVEIPLKAGSLEELHLGDFAKWEHNNTTLMCSAKLDGVSCLLHYDSNGKFIEAVSRGDGSVGKDITRHYIRTRGAIFQIPIEAECWIRGELIIPKDDFQNIVKQTNGKYKVARNTASGFINAKETNEIIAENINFVAYSIMSEYLLGIITKNGNYKSIDVIKTEKDMFDALNICGFKTPLHWKYEVNKDSNPEKDFIEKVKYLKENYMYDVDGIVLTVNIHNMWNGFETGTYNPKYSRKFKVGGSDNTAETIVESISWQISKSGKLTPVLNVKPVIIQGVEVSNVTANNFDWLSKNKCGVNSRIIVKRSGDVIPYVLEVLDKSEEYDIPSYSKREGVNLVIDKTIITNELIFDEQNIQRLVFFGKSLDIEQWGYGNCKEIYNYTKITPETFCQLKEGIITDIIGENGRKIEKSWQEKKNNITEVEYASACNSFGIGIGKRILQPIYDKYETLNVSKHQLMCIEGFAEKRVNQYISHILSWLETKRIAEENGIVFKRNPKIESNKFNGLVIGFTGVRDKELMEYINKNGGIAQDSISSKTNVLIAKDVNANSSKLIKAREKGIEIITLDEAKRRYYSE